MTEIESASHRSKYWAFISYSHADEAWAKWLHKAIETYGVPVRLQKHATPAGPAPKRFFPIFRDRDELPSSPELGGVIREALVASRWLIVICSPRAAASRWVDEEVRHFKSLGRENRVLALIIDGEPHGDAAIECFCPALKVHVAVDKTLTDEAAEPIAADARAGKDARRGALLKLLAGMLGVGYDELVQREAVRLRWQRAGIVALVGAVLVSLTSLWQWQVHERQQALAAQALQVRRAALYENGRRELLAGRQARSAVYLVGALQLGLDTPALRFMLGRAMREVDAFQKRYLIGSPVITVTAEPKGHRLAVIGDDGTVHVLDVSDGRELSARPGEKVLRADNPYFINGGKTLVLNVFSLGHANAELVVGDTEAKTWRERRPSSGDHIEVSIGGNRIAYLDAQEQVRIFASDGSGFERNYGAATVARLSADGQQLWLGSSKGAVRRLRCDSGATLASYEGLSESVRALRASPDGELIAAAGIGGEVRVWEVKTGRLRFTAGQAQQVVELEFSADSQRLRASGKDGNAVWDTHRGQLLMADKATNFLGNPAGFVHDGEWLAQIKDGSLILSDAATGQALLNLDGHSGPAGTFATTDDPQVFYSAGDDGSIVRWALPPEARAAFHVGGAAGVVAEGDPQVPVAYAEQGDLFAFGRADGMVEVHRNSDAALVWTLSGHGSRITAVAFAPDGHSLAAGNHEGQVAVWPLADERAARWLQGPGGATALLRWAPDSRHVAGAFLGARTRVWAWPEGLVAADFYPRDATRALAFSPDGRRLAIGQQGHAKLWDLAAGQFVWDQPLPLDEGEKGFANVFAFRSDGRQLFASLVRRKLFLLNVDSGAIETAVTVESSSSFSSGGFSPDQTSIVIGDYSKLAYRWTPADGQVTQFEGHSDAVSSALTDPDGALIATGSDDGTVKLWDTATGALLETLARHKGSIRYGNVLFSRDGSSLLSAGQDQIVQLHALPREARSVSELQKVIACKAPWALAAETLKPQPLTVAGCSSP